jgi:hypothetical protein
MYTPLLHTLLRNCVLALAVRTAAGFRHAVWRSLFDMAAVSRRPVEEGRDNDVGPHRT